MLDPLTRLSDGETVRLVILFFGMSINDETTEEIKRQNIKLFGSARPGRLAAKQRGNKHLSEAYVDVNVGHPPLRHTHHSLHCV